MSLPARENGRSAPRRSLSVTDSRAGVFRLIRLMINENRPFRQGGVFTKFASPGSGPGGRDLFAKVTQLPQETRLVAGKA